MTTYQASQSPVSTLVSSLRTDRRSVKPGPCVNAEGAPAHCRSLREQTVQVLTTGMLSDAFYAKGSELAREASTVLTAMRDEDPMFLAQAIVYARTEGYMKLVPTLGLAILSAGRRRETVAAFRAAFPRTVRIPDDLRNFAELCLFDAIPGRTGLGGIARETVREWIGEMSEYHALKYGSAASRGVTLRDVLRLTHPRPATAAMAERFGWLVKGAAGLGSDSGMNPQLHAFEALKRAMSEDEVVALIANARLPFEVVVPAVKATTPAIWSALLRHAPYMNLLRSLVTYTRHGVFADEANVALAVERLTDPRAIARSMALPFRFFDAWRRYTEMDGNDVRIADALRVALERSFQNLPALDGGAVCIGTDVSGSMSNVISDKGSTRFIDIAGIFTGALLRRIEGRVIALPFEGRVRLDGNLSARDDVMVTAEKIAGLGGGSTAVGAPVEYLLERKLVVNTFIGITDNVDWAHGPEQLVSGPFLDLWRRYRREMNPKAEAFLVTIAPHRELVAPLGEPGVHFIYGWSDRVPSYIARTLKTGESQLDAVRAIDLGTGERNAAPPEDSSDDEPETE